MIIRFTSNSRPIGVYQDVDTLENYLDHTTLFTAAYLLLGPGQPQSVSGYYWESSGK